MEHTGWEVDFKGGPLNNQVKQFAEEPGEEIEVSPEDGGPFTYLRVASVDPDSPSDPIKLVYHPEPGMESQEANKERTLGGDRLKQALPGVNPGDVDKGFDDQFRGAH